LRLQVTIETSFGWPLGRPLGLKSESWPIHVERDAVST